MYQKLILFTIFINLFLIHFSFSFSSDTDTSFFQLRKFFVGGDFSSVIDDNSTPHNYSNFAYYDGSTWHQMGGLAPNGPVYYVFVDICRNTYIGGKFSKVGDIETGPVAKYNYFKGRWEKVGSGAVFSEDAYVKAIYADCTNILNFQYGECGCDVYFGGNFNMTYGGKSVLHVAKYNSWTQNWDLLDYNERCFKKEDEVRTLYKKPLGITEASQILWVGGSFDRYLKRYNLAPVGGIRGWLDIESIGGPVNAIWYDPAFWLLDIDKMYIGGEFDRQCGTGRCKNVAYYVYRGSELGWHSIVSDSNSDMLPNGPINTIYKVSDKLYLAGNYNQTNPDYSYLGIADLTKKTVSPLMAMDYNSNEIKSPLYDIAVCSATESNIGCEEGSVLMCGSDDYLKFFNKKLTQFEKYGNGINGQAYTIAYAYMIGNSNLIYLSNFLKISIIIFSIILFC